MTTATVAIRAFGGERAEQVRKIRDLALDVVNARGSWRSAGKARILLAEVANLKMGVWSAFSTPLPPNHTHALLRQRELDFPCALDIWFKNKKVLSIRWRDDGHLQIISFKRGDWEQLVSGLAP